MPTLDTELENTLRDATLKHARTPEERFSHYRRSRFQALESFVAARRTVYLEMNFWIWLRDPSEAPQPIKTSHLRELLLTAVSEGHLLCPVSYTAFLEMMKQPMEKRLAQARLMDQLSEGVGIRNQFDTAEIEYTRFLSQKVAALKDIPIDPIWAPVGHLIHEVYAPADALSEHLWKVSLDVHFAKKMEHYAKSMQGMPIPPPTTAARINTERQSNLRGNKTFDQLFSDELDGILDVMSPHIENTLNNAACFVGIEVTGQLMEEHERRTWIKTIRECVLHDATGQVIPSERISAALHAAVRLDDRHLLEENDIADIGHSSVAAAYCDVFLTERRFAHFLRLPAVQRVIPRRCSVISDIDEAIAVVTALTTATHLS